MSGRSERAQASVELLGAVPALLALGLALLQLMAVGYSGVLAGAAAEAGMDADVVRDLLAGDSDRELVLAELEVAHRLRISGVPTFVIDQKYMISGAQEPDVLVGVLDRIAAQSMPDRDRISPSDPA